MEERLRFIEALLDGEYDNMSELCRAFGISGKTGYKWLERFKQGGAATLGDRSRAAHRHPNATPDKVVELVVAARRMHPTWGPKKLQVWLRVRGWPVRLGIIGREFGVDPWYPTRHPELETVLLQRRAS